MENSSYNPDVLNCIANLSNDEVFTPPELANNVLDLLPQELFRSPKTTFLDPFTKSGVFLREIVKRLDRGLESVIPDRQERIDHILHNQVFGIACTELTSLLSRRSVYCSKSADGKYSVSRFKTPSGNILYSNINHTWEGGKCKYCGASQAVYDRGSESEQYAYMFIHTDNPGKFFNNMKFDVIIGNPPYQLNDGGNGASATPIYHLFIEQAKKLQPRFLLMIIPSRWLSGGRGLDSFRDEMLHDNQIRILHDYESSLECFSGVEIKGGVCYFLWEKGYHGNCFVVTHGINKIVSSNRPLLEEGFDTFIRHNEQVSVLFKVKQKKEKMLSTWINAGRFFGFHTKVIWDKDNNSGLIQTADGQSFIKMRRNKDDDSDVRVFIHGGDCWVKIQDIPRNQNRIEEYKVLLPRSGNPGSTIIGKPIVSEPGTCNSNTYCVVIPPDRQLSETEAVNMFNYIKTRFFRFLVSAKTTTQSTSTNAFDFVPLQDFSHPWTDEMLYKKYGLTEDEIAFIESMIRPME